VKLYAAGELGKLLVAPHKRAAQVSTEQARWTLLLDVARIIRGPFPSTTGIRVRPEDRVLAGNGLELREITGEDGRPLWRRDVLEPLWLNAYVTDDDYDGTSVRRWIEHQLATALLRPATARALEGRAPATPGRTLHDRPAKCP
jgi:hypothetical protein